MAMKRIYIKNFIIDSTTQTPLVILHTFASRKAIQIPINFLDIPKILSILYKNTIDSLDIYQVIIKLFRQLKFIKIRRLVLIRKKNLACELHYSILRLVPMRLEVSISDGLILHLLYRIPFYADNSILKSEDYNTGIEATQKTIYPQEILENWNPSDSDVIIN